MADDQPDEVLDHGAALGAASSLAALTFSSVYLLGDKLSTLTKERPVVLGVLTLYTLILSSAAFLSGLAVLAQIIAFVWPHSDSHWAIFARKLLRSAACVVFVWGGVYGILMSIAVGIASYAAMLLPGYEDSWRENLILIVLLVVTFVIGRLALAAFPLDEAEGLSEFSFAGELTRGRAVALLTFCCLGAIGFTFSRYQFEAHLSPSVVNAEAKIVEIRVTISGFGVDRAAPEAHVQRAGDLKAHPQVAKITLMKEEHGSYVGWLRLQGLPVGVYSVEISPGFEPEKESNRIKTWYDRTLMRRLGVKQLAFFVSEKV
jgi:hypothetical protein